MDDLIPAAEVARRLGIRTRTLAKWRCSNRGPKGWVKQSATAVFYPKSEVEQYVERLKKAV